MCRVLRWVFLYSSVALIAAGCDNKANPISKPDDTVTAPIAQQKVQTPAAVSQPPKHAPETVPSAPQNTLPPASETVTSAPPSSLPPASEIVTSVPPSPLPPAPEIVTSVPQNPIHPTSSTLTTAGTQKQEVNLLPNGDFGEWPKDQRLPLNWTHGYGYALDELPSTIEPFDGETYDNWKAVRQTWKKSDGSDSVFRQFGNTVSDLKPDTNYRLSFKALNSKGVPAQIAIWAVTGDEGDKVERISSSELKVEKSDSFVDYFTQFNSGKATRIRIVTFCGKAKSMGSVVWDAWRLTTEETNVDNLIVNGRFGNWPNDQRLPIGWTHGMGYTLETMPSKIERYSGKSPVPGLAVLQTWRANDGSDNIARQFGQTVANLKPNTTYQLRLKALNLSDKSAKVAAWETTEDVNGPVKKLSDQFITVAPSKKFGFLDYSGVFNTGSANRVRFVTFCTEKGVKVLWTDFELTEIQ
jgi:hypothetical protein